MLKTKTAARSASRQLATLASAQETLRQLGNDAAADAIQPTADRLTRDLDEYYQNGGI